MDLRYKLKTAPVFNAVTVAELKRNLRIEDEDRNDLLQDLIGRAVAASQTATGRQYTRATYTLYLDAFPFDTNEIEIDKGPVDQISSVKYLAPGATVLTTVDAALYQLDNSELTSRLRFFSTLYPDTTKMNVIEIEFTTGWPDANSIPKDLTEAIILRASDGYLHPDNSTLNFRGSLEIKTAEIRERNYQVQRY
jgi:uncharacterized phiE125 gp8 family phage protein